MKKLGAHKQAILQFLLSQGFIGATSNEMDERFKGPDAEFFADKEFRKCHKAMPELEKAGLVFRKYDAISGHRATRGPMTPFGAPQVWLHKDFNTAERDEMSRTDAQFMAEINGITDKVTEEARTQRPAMPA